MVHLHWEDVPLGNSTKLGVRRVLYMFTTPDEPLYIGEAGRQALRGCIHRHDHEGMFRWIARHVDGPVILRVAHLAFGPGQKYSAELLHDLQTLLVYTEHNILGRCRLNASGTKTRKVWRPGEIVVNGGAFEPLLPAYVDDDE